MFLFCGKRRPGWTDQLAIHGRIIFLSICRNCQKRLRRIELPLQVVVGNLRCQKNEKNMENQNESMGKSLSSLLLVDNLDGQCQPEFATILKGWKSMEGGVARSKKIAMEIV